MRLAVPSRALLLFSALFALVLLPTAGCNPGRAGGPGRRDGGPTGPGRDAPAARCDSPADTDGDGIADAREVGDTDGDGTPDAADADSDADGIPDSVEAASTNPCAPADSDADGYYDAIDRDSDNDGVPDDAEVAAGTSPTNIDTDGDGITDLGERAAGTDPTDPTSRIPEDDFFVVLPYGGPQEDRPLTFGTNISQADVYFLVDTTGSMTGPITNVRTSLSRIATSLDAIIDDLQMGVGHHDDFPFEFDGYGSAGDDAYVNLQDITPDITAVQNALNALALGNGYDGPESQTFAIYQTASGAGGAYMGSGGELWSIPNRVCSDIPDEMGRRRGYPCFRPGSLPIVVLVSDVSWHNGAAGVDYLGVSPAAPTFADAAAAMNNIGARFIGVAVNGGGRPDDEAMATMTGSVTGAGVPLVFDAAAGEVSDAIIDGITSLVGGTPQDVTTTREDVLGDPPAPAAEVDATRFIIAIVPVQGYGVGGPGTGFDGMDATTFYNVIPGTRVEFRVEFINNFYPPPAVAEVFQATIIVLGNGVARLDSHRVFIVVPPEGDDIVLM
jgi:hypothetical protein